MKDLVRQYIEYKEASLEHLNEKAFLEIKEIKNNVEMLDDFLSFINN